ncbi:MAG: PQQ-dependent sugar dehydrogenase [Sulfitobacter sp.]|nr:PQQ-dependent sugar dehydrogenase [Sulfitobacter sp.]
MFRSVLFAFSLCLSAVQLCAQNFNIEQTIAGLDTPWAIAVLPDGTVLVTEIDGRLLRFSNGALMQISGTPSVADSGQGGLLDITLARDFATSRTLFLTYAKPMRGGAGTALATAELSADGLRLENMRDLFVMSAGSRAGRHFGSRVVEGVDGTLFMTIGDRGDDMKAQDRSVHNGSVIRVNRDGSVPDDNPFIGQPDILPEIWSYGHRNPQGAALDLDGTLWVSEHGARGGDEVNKIKKGANFGWPVISYGRHYSGRKIGEGTSKPGMEQPAFYWDPSIAPSGLLIYSGKMFPNWRGDMFVGSLKFDYIARLEGDPLREVEQIKTEQTIRVRDIIEAPDGSIWFISVGNGGVYRIFAD